MIESISRSLFKIQCVISFQSADFRTIFIYYRTLILSNLIIKGQCHIIHRNWVPNTTCVTSFTPLDNEGYCLVITVLENLFLLTNLYRLI
jgi:hypothetical protein